MKCTHTYTSSNLAFEKGFLDTSEVHEGSNSLASSQGKARVGKAVKRNYRGGHRILPLDRTTVHLLGQSLLWELCPCIIVPSKTRDSQWQPFPLTVRTRIPTVPHITDPLVYLIGRFTTVHLYPPKGLLRLQILKRCAARRPHTPIAPEACVRSDTHFF